jgi:hypothetical protein
MKKTKSSCNNTSIYAVTIIAKKSFVRIAKSHHIKAAAVNSIKNGNKKIAKVT